MSKCRVTESYDDDGAGCLFQFEEEKKKKESDSLGSGPVLVDV